MTTWDKDVSDLENAAVAVLQTVPVGFLDRRVVGSNLISWNWIDIALQDSATEYLVKQFLRKYVHFMVFGEDTENNIL